MSFVGKKFPNLSVDAMNEMGDTFKVNVLEEAVNNKKKVVLFWYPKDFTFVCPTELHAFEAAKADYERILKFNPNYENAKKGLERLAQTTNK